MSGFVNVESDAFHLERLNVGRFSHNK